MSTGSEMERMPASRSGEVIHGGVGRGGIDTAHGAGHETVAAGLAVDRGVVVELDAVAAGERLRNLDLRRRVA